MKRLYKIICKLLGHKYYVYAKPKENWSNGVRWLKCGRCHSNFVINDSVRVLLPMDNELMNLHGWTNTK